MLAQPLGRARGSTGVERCGFGVIGRRFQLRLSSRRLGLVSKNQGGSAEHLVEVTVVELVVPSQRDYFWAEAVEHLVAVLMVVELEVQI